MWSPSKRISERKGSPRHRRQQTLVFTSLWVALFPFVWFTLQWNQFFEQHNTTGFWPSSVLTMPSLDQDDSPSTFHDLPTPADTLATNANVGTRTDDDGSSSSTRSSRSLILDPREHPIVVEPERYSSDNPFPVSFVGREGSGFYQEALEASSRIRVCSRRIWGEEERITYPPKEEIISESCHPHLLIVDWSSLDRDCHFLQNTLPEGLPVLLIDASPSVRLVSCPDALGKHIVYNAKRSVVEQRWWRFDDRSIHRGHVVDAEAYALPGCVTNAVADIFMKQQTKTVDVLHYWNSITAGNNTDAVVRQYSSLRAAISRQIQSTNRSLQKKGHDGTWWEHFGLEGEDDENDEELSPADLLQEMATSLASAKIIVVTQSDEYEDHDNRLMEALASGALVMSDVMLAPPMGLVNATNVIFFNTRNSLDRLLRYYLKHDSKRQAIGKEGRKFALNHHRCWQVMESLLFGTHD